MGTPNARSILTNIKATLEGITAANGYHTTVATVALTAQDWDSARSSGVYPWLGIIPGESRATYVFSAARVSRTIRIVGHVSASTDSAAYDAIENLVDDLIAALHSDSTRGGNAVKTTVVSWDSDEADPDRVRAAQGGTATLVMEIDVTHERALTLS